MSAGQQEALDRAGSRFAPREVSPLSDRYPREVILPGVGLAQWWSNVGAGWHWYVHEGVPYKVRIKAGRVVIVETWQQQPGWKRELNPDG